MKNLLILAVVLLGFTFDTSATHLEGGHITYTHVSGFTYNITVETISKSSSAGDELYVRMCGALDDSVPRSSVTIFIYEDRQINGYAMVHTFPGPGTYEFCVQGINRIGGIQNIPSSISEGMGLKSVLVISPLLTPNSSVFFDQRPAYGFGLGEDNRYNVTAVDLDGDSLSYRLITPLSDVGLPIAGYQYPDALGGGTFVHNSLTGEIIWDNPQLPGQYAVSAMVCEWRAGQQIGYVIKDFLLTVSNVNRTFYWDNVQTWDTNAVGDYLYEIPVGQTLTLEPVLNYAGNGGFTLECAGELCLAGSSTFTATSGPTAINGFFNWTPTAANVRNHPYIIVFRASVDTTSLYQEQNDLTVRVYVEQAPVAVPEQLSPSAALTLYPNPMTQQITFDFDQERSNSTLMLFDGSGRLVKTVRQVQGAQFRLKRRGLPSGVYFYYFEHSNGDVDRGRLTII
jgi:hypothetical protein